MKLLLIDDDESVNFALSELFRNENYDVTAVFSAEEALSKLETDKYNIALIDYNLPGINGLDLLSIIRKNYSWMEAIIITAFGSEKVAVEAVKKGAYDYISKPFENLMLVNRINHIRDSMISKNTSEENGFGYYFSPVMTAIIEKIKTVSKTDIPILITGESGTGKELIAKLCHHYSERKGNFISINCSALPENLIESELFGAEKGSYTGSVGRKIGLFEQADNGTIFLDEIGEMAIEVQAKLLRVIQENEIMRIGSGDTIKINARVLAATNIDIEERVKKNLFREDLFYRLNVVRLRIPSLAHRKEEIKPLSLMFLKDFNTKYKKEIKGFDDDTLNEILNYPWHGNIRELKNKIEHSVILCGSSWINQEHMELDDYIIYENEDTENEPDPEILKKINKDVNIKDDIIDVKSLPSGYVEAKKQINDLFDKKFILFHLNKNNWNVRLAAESIGLSRQDLYKKMKKVGIKKNIEFS